MNCPSCRKPMQETFDLSGRRTRRPIHLCIPCGIDLDRRTEEELAVNRGEVQPKLARMDRGRQTRKIVRPEKEIEDEVDRLCRLEGWECLSTTHRIQFIKIYCPNCVRAGRYIPITVQCPTCHRGFDKCRAVGKDAGYGADRGIADRLIAPDWLPPFLSFEIELKGTQTPLSEAQKDRAARQRIAVARGADDVIAAMNTVREFLRMEPLHAS